MMNHPSFHSLKIAGLLLGAFVSSVAAQVNLPFGPSNYEHDLQMFAPLELDLDNSREDQWSGYFVNYNKLFWSYTGERVTVGDPNVVVFAEEVYLANPFDEGIRPDAPQIRNGLTDVPPHAGFAFGDRYELGYRDQDQGWMIGILVGPELNQTEFHGFARVDTNADGIPDGLPPFIDDDYTDGTDVGPGTGPVQDVRAFGYGSVPVNFSAPPGYMLGFRDYLQNEWGAEAGTGFGPLMYIGSYGAVAQEPDQGDGPPLRQADDLDEDGIPGAFGVVDPVTGETVLVTDFDDLHIFNIFFDSVTVHNTTETNGVEAMWSHTLTNSHYMAKHQNNEVTLSLGARYLRLYDQFRVDALGSILHDAFWDTSFRNQIVGPQVGVRWVNRRQRWTLEANGRFMFGYNTADWDQLGLIGEGMVPGGLNQLLFGRPTAFSHGLQEREFSPVAEMRLQTTYHITRGFALKAGYTGMFVGNIRRAAPSVFYNLPDMGYLDAGTQDLLVNGLDLGLEFVH
jgi:hypothetical protein